MSQKRSLTIGGVIIILAVVATLTVWRPWHSETTATKLKIINVGSFLEAIDYGPYLVAKNKGWFEEEFKKEGITVKYSTFQTLPPINESFATGRVDVVFEAETPAVIGKAAGIDLRIVALSASLMQEIVTPTNSKIKELEDLKGKKIAVLAGTGSHYGLLKVLKKVGIKSSDVSIIDMFPPAAKNAFETGQVDAWAVWPPFVEQEVISKKGRIIPKGSAAIQSVMVVRGEFIKKYPMIVHKLVKVLQRAKKWTKENPEEAQKIIAEELNIPIEVVKLAWSRHDWAAKINDEITNDIQLKANFFYENKFVKKKVEVKNELLDLSFEK